LEEKIKIKDLNHGDTESTEKSFWKRRSKSFTTEDTEKNIFRRRSKSKG